MSVSGHRTRSVFDRYSLSLKAQTRKALRHVSAHTQALDPTRGSFRYNGRHNGVAQTTSRSSLTLQRRGSTSTSSLLRV
jgi:hypothetical protein